MSIHIVLERSDKTYRIGDSVVGRVEVDSKSSIPHSGVLLHVRGSVNLEIYRSKSILDRLYQSQPISLLEVDLTLCPPGKIPAGKSSFAFFFPLSPSEKNFQLFETYRGRQISVQYTISAEILRSLLAPKMATSLEIIVESKPARPLRDSKRVSYAITPTSQRHGLSPKFLEPGMAFRITGELASDVCAMDGSIRGSVCIRRSPTPIRTIDVFLVALDSCMLPDGTWSVKSSQVASVQVVDGDACRDAEVPFLLMPPRLYTAPTFCTPRFGVAFEVHVQVEFDMATSAEDKPRGGKLGALLTGTDDSQSNVAFHQIPFTLIA
eukprot:jgi/Mesvir1/14897/Mv05500-RA.1